MTDISRDTFQSDSHYLAVREQQGRVLLDSEWNEQIDIQCHLDETTRHDLLGDSGVPQDHAGGFEVQPTSDQSDLQILPGRMYVNGVLCELEHATSYLEQPDYRDPLAHDPVTANGNYLAYLDVWQRPITAVEVAELLEPALGGADTATRLKTIWQVKLLPVPEGVSPDVACAGDFDHWRELAALGTGRLSGRAVAPAEVDCLTPPGAGYVGLNHQTYRVEIHQGGDAPTFKWSRDNGAVVYSIAEFVAGEPRKIRVGDLVRNDHTILQEDDWVEVSDDDRELAGKKGLLARITNVDRVADILTLDTDIDEFNVDEHHSKLRRWDMVGEGIADGVPVPKDGDYVALENGVEVSFSEGRYRTGDYWIIPARAITNGDTLGDIQWPRDDEGNPIPQSPRGIRHNYCPLALVDVSLVNGAPQFQWLKDCRRQFPQLCPLDTGFRITGLFAENANHVRQPLRGGEQVTVQSFSEGIGIVCSDDVAAVSVHDKPVCDVTLQLPYPLSQVTIGNFPIFQQNAGPLGTRPLKLAADVSTDKSVIRWMPLQAAQLWLQENLISICRILQIKRLPQRILALLTVKGNFIWSDGNPRRLLDGESFGEPGATDPTMTDVRLPSGDGRPGGDFFMWFWLVPQQLPPPPPQFGVKFSIHNQHQDVHGNYWIRGGDLINGDVTLTPTPTETVLVDLSATKTHRNLATVEPGTLEFPSNSDTQAFTIETKRVVLLRHLELRASRQDSEVSASVILHLLPAWLAHLTLEKHEVPGGTSVAGTVSLGAPAPEGGADVTLSASGPTADMVTLSPQTVAVAVGESTKDFTVATKEVSERTRVVICAAYSDEETTVELDLLPRPPAPRVAAVELDRATTVGGEPVAAQVRLTDPAQDTVQVDLDVSITPETAADRVTVPPSVPVRRNQKSAGFQITTRSVGRQTNVVVTARLGGEAAEASLTVQPKPEEPTTPPRLQSLTLQTERKDEDGNYLIEGGKSLTGSVSLDKPPTKRVIVDLSVTETFRGLISVEPETQDFEPGSAEAGFTIATKPVVIRRFVEIRATLQDETRRAGIWLLP